jgi:hypothetical protein
MRRLRSWESLTLLLIWVAIYPLGPVIGNAQVVPVCGPPSKSRSLWCLPHRFWAAMRNMPKEHADRLLDEVITLAEVRDLEALRKYDFVSLENLYSRRIA